MREDYINLWEIPADARVITTNGTIKANGRAVMGRGCAREATQKFPYLQIALGRHLQTHGNHVGLLRWSGDPEYALVAMPVKHEWHLRADLKLIEQSTIELVALADKYEWKQIALPRPGCGNGQQRWSVVRGIIQPYLDDRFTVVTFDDAYRQES